MRWQLELILILYGASVHVGFKVEFTSSSSSCHFPKRFWGRDSIAQDILRDGVHTQNCHTTFRGACNGTGRLTNPIIDQPHLCGNKSGHSPYDQSNCGTACTLLWSQLKWLIPIGLEPNSSAYEEPGRNKIQLRARAQDGMILSNPGRVKNFHESGFHALKTRSTFRTKKWTMSQVPIGNDLPRRSSY